MPSNPVPLKTPVGNNADILIFVWQIIERRTPASAPCLQLAVGHHYPGRVELFQRVASTLFLAWPA